MEKLFDKLIEKIKNSEWFTSEWDIYRNGNYIHVFKKNWLDENHKGVHFETYAKEDSNEFPVVLHAEGDVPNRDEFVQKVLEEVRDKEGFEFGVNNYTIMQKIIPVNKESFVEEVLKTLEELQFVVDVVDKNL